MSGTPGRYPTLFQLNTRVRLTALARELGRPATLDDISDQDFDRLAAMGFDWVWLLSVWQTGPAAQRISRTNPEWRNEFQHTLTDLRDDDIPGSGFAITGYTVHESLGGDAALARLRTRMQSRGLRLMRAPANYAWAKRTKGNLILAHGRDPYFPGWPDTFQLNYGNRATQEAMIEELTKIAGQCDGVRCDMAMLVLPDVFERTWGIPSQPFWSTAIRRVRTLAPNFCFMAEAYWDLEWTLQQQGFDYTYDKRLYDRLREGHARPVREHFLAGLDYQNKLARFLENHDEPRAAATFTQGVHEAAAVITFLSPGLRFFHEGQFEGRRIRISPHLGRGPIEPVNRDLQRFYDRLLAVLRQPVVRDGQWRLLECVPAWEGNWTWDCFVAFAWEGHDGERLLVAVNFAPNQSQCYARLPFANLPSRGWQLRDQMGSVTYDRNGDELQSTGLYLDMKPWETFVFSMKMRNP